MRRKNSNYKNLFNEARELLKEQDISHKKELKEAIEQTRRECLLGVKEKVRKGRRETWKKIIPIVTKKNKSYRYNLNETVKKKAVLLANNRVQKYRLQRTIYMDGVLAFPVILTYCKAVKMIPYEMVFLIMLNMQKELRTIDCLAWGFTRGEASRRLNGMVELGLAERFKDGHVNSVYSANLKGIKVFREFRIYYRKSVTEKLKNDEDKQRHHRWIE